MKLADFTLERWFARYEFVTKHLLCASDVEAYPMAALVNGMDDECRALWETLTLGYWPATGHPLLRREIASLHDSDRGLPVTEDDVLVFSGAQEAIFVAMNVLLTNSDHVVATWPGYQSLYEVARACGAEVTLLALDRAQGWRLDLDELRRSIRPNTRALIINFPHNPTGALLSTAELDELLSIADAAGITVFSDEVYRFLELDPGTRLPGAVERSERAISLGVMSKSFGLAGLRIGWLVVRDAKLRQRFAAFKDYLSICSSAPSEVLAIAALRARQTLLARSHGIVRKNLEHLDAFFERRSALVSWVRPRAGSVAFPRLVSGAPADDLARHLAEDHGVLILPGSVYGFSADHFRIGLGRVDLVEGLAKFEAVLASQ
jgi:aspartate/methionine/tyrosine aminotransferase